MRTHESVTQYACCSKCKSVGQFECVPASKSVEPVYLACVSGVRACGYMCVRVCTCEYAQVGACVYLCVRILNVMVPISHYRPSIPL